MKRISMNKIMNSTKVTKMKSGYTPEWAVVLEPVRKLPTNVGSRIRRCIHEALEKGPPEWAKKRLEVSISKDVYKGNAAGPTKRAVVSVLADLQHKIIQEKVEKKKNKKKKKRKKVDEECIGDGVDDLVVKKKVDEECSVDDLVMKERIEEEFIGDSVDDLVMEKKVDEECIGDSDDGLVMKGKIEEECIGDGVDDLVMEKKIGEECIGDGVDDLVMKEKTEEESIGDGVDDLVMKQCRIVFRSVAAEDKDGVFFDFLKGNGNEDGCCIGEPVLGSFCLDFRSIDLRLADGSYCGSHEAFYDDVQEVWSNIRVSFKEQVDLVKLAERLERSFGEMYEKEVLAIVQKPAERASSVAIKERDDSVTRVSESLILQAQREEGLCEVCGIDEDDDNVLLCDGCDSEYHRYCLNSPLAKIPKGDWYCPSCVSAQSLSRSRVSSSGVDSQCNLEKGRPNQLANPMMIKELKELDNEEGTICLQCGDVGFDNAYVYCIKCLKFVVHRYCLPEMPKTFDEFVHWVCDHCGAVSSLSAR